MRPLTAAILRLACRLLPARMRQWGEAATREAEAIDRPGEALAFAFGCLIWAVRESATSRLSQSFRRQSKLMSFTDDLRGPRGIALLCAAAATGLGLIYMAVGGAPDRYLMINAGAFAFGLAALAMLALADRRGHLAPRLLIGLLGAVLLATSLLGVRVDGITRWLALGPLTIQPAMMVLPLMVVLFARCRGVVSLAGMALAALALALQPDRAMAGALAIGLAVLACTRPNRSVIAALALATISFIATLVQPDPSPAMPFVDKIFYSSFAIHPLAGPAVILGSAMMIVPVLLLRRARGPERATVAVFSAVWAAIIAAAALGNYPTPLVGYGGSAVIGYLMSLMVFPRRAFTAAVLSDMDPETVASQDEGPVLYIGTG